MTLKRMGPELRPYPGPEHQAFQVGEGPGGALLIHGFPGTPAELRGVAQALAANGWHARAPLLPGFGPDIVNMAEKRRRDWLGAVQAEWEGLRKTHAPRLLLGYSMGGALALHLAHRLPPDRLVLIAPFWRLPGILPRLMPILKLVMPQMRPFKNVDFNDPGVRDGFQRLLPDIDLDDPELQTYIGEKMILPMAVVHEVLRMGAESYRLARSVTVPTLVIQGHDDEMVRPDLTRRLVGRLGSEWVSYRELAGGHELIHDHTPQSRIVTELILNYLREQA